MAERDHALLTGTWVDHEPILGGLLDPFTYEEFAVTRPRTTGGRLCGTSVEGGGLGTQTC